MSAAPGLAGRLLRYLHERGRSLSPLLILTHDHPDPDALASAWALAHLASSVARVRCRVAYSGVIGRRENRAMVESLEVPAYPLRPGDLNEFAATALVDTQPPFRNNRYPPRRHPDLIVDHHPRHADTQADCCLIDKSVGATTTVLAEALKAAGLKVPPRLATAIVYGIGSETQNLGREAGRRDVRAYFEYLPRVNRQMLWRIAYPRRPASFFTVLARAIRHAFTCRNIIGVHLGLLPNPDRVAQMADFLLTHEGMQWSFVTGRYQGRLHVSLRTTRVDEAAGRLLKRLLGGGNRGGGHRMIAGGSVDLGEGAREAKWREAEDAVAVGFLKSRGVSDPHDRVYPFRD